MSHFFRQFHLMSSLKTNSERELLPFYKVMAPVLSRHPAVKRMHTQTIANNIKLKTVDLNEGQKKKKLVVIFTWILAQDRHVEKIRKLYISRGFDVLTMDTLPKDFLFPTTGTQVMTTKLLDYIVDNNGHYDKILVHAFSVGGYLMGEMFVKIRDNVERYREVTKKISGVILDSVVDFDGTSDGIARAVSKNPLTCKVLEWYINAHLALMYNVATKHYIKSCKNFHNTPLSCPALCFVSEADKIGTPEANKALIGNWVTKGVDCKMKSFKDSKHVGHFFKYENEYVKELDEFLQKVDLVPKLA